MVVRARRTRDVARPGRRLPGANRRDDEDRRWRADVVRRRAASRRQRARRSRYRRSDGAGGLVGAGVGGSVAGTWSGGGIEGELSRFSRCLTEDAGGSFRHVNGDKKALWIQIIIA